MLYGPPAAGNCRLELQVHRLAEEPDGGVPMVTDLLTSVTGVLIKESRILGTSGVPTWPPLTPLCVTTGLEMSEVSVLRKS